MRITPADATSAVDPRHWRVVLGRLRTTVETGSFTTGVDLVTRVAELAEQHGHHPDVVLRYPDVSLTLTTHDESGLTQKDTALAVAISSLVDTLGLTARPGAPQATEIAIDALDIPAVLPFWRAVLGYRDERPAAADASPALEDPSGTGPTVWFQQMDAPRPQRNRIHLDVSVPHDVAQGRVDAALAAGGRLVSDTRAPAFWVLADPEGNEACVCTWQDRD